MLQHPIEPSAKIRSTPSISLPLEWLTINDRESLGSSRRISVCIVLPEPTMTVFCVLVSEG